MQSFPGFAERAEAAFGAGAWRVGETVARFTAGSASDGECSDEGEGASCRAFEAEADETAEDVLARGHSSPPHHVVELLPEDDDVPAGKTLYVLDEPLFVGSGGRGDGREAVNWAPRSSAALVEQPGRSSEVAPTPSAHSPVKFQGAPVSAVGGEATSA